MKIIFDYNRTLFNPETSDLYDGALELLTSLSKKHTLFLVSRNEPIRHNRIAELGIKDFFADVRFVEKKEPKLFLELVNGSKDVLVVGDRVRAEIFVGNSLGFKTVWVKQGLFGKEGPTSEMENPNHEIENISELKDLIKIYE